LYEYHFMNPGLLSNFSCTFLSGIQVPFFVLHRELP
jgi:hypothetical protein